jgi:hypothetical protein
MKRDTENKITVEALLRLKRAERPPAEFWSSFEAQIRTKQLSAIVSRRPWWDRFSRVFALVGRHQLSFGTAAAVALVFGGFRYLSARPEVAYARPATVPVHAVAVEPLPINVARAVVSAPAPREEIAMGARESAPAAQPVVKATASHLTQAPAAAASDSLSKSPFADAVAIKLADFREPASEYARPSVFGSDRDFEPAVAPARQTISDPLARMDPAAERRARLLAPALPAYASGSPGSLAGDWMRQRASSDDRMYESMDRGSSDDRMLVGFRF